ncbi:MAG: hypothetical protein K2R98_18210 [Gemmataceae bacterium]|nr:hypothetical protein [Gemmataceae bacterium]
MPRLMWLTTGVAMVGTVLWIVHFVSSPESQEHNVASMVSWMERNQPETGELESRLGDVKERVRNKQWVVREVIAERMTLLEAAAWFRQLHALYPDYIDVLRRAHPGRGDAEVLCLNVIAFVRSALREHGGNSGPLVLGLEREMKDRIENGTLSLPERIAAR